MSPASPSNVVFGLAAVKPFIPAPAGRVRVRLRGDDIARAYVRTAEGVREYSILACGNHWQLGHLLGANLRPVSCPPSPVS